MRTDLDGDCIGDLVGGVFRFFSTGAEPGEVIVLYGSPTGGVRDVQVVPVPEAGFVRFGNSLTGLGDVDGDGFDDLGVSGRAIDPRGGARVWVLRGGPSALADVILDVDVRTETDEGAGTTVHRLDDVDGDGRAEVGVGELAFGSGQLIVASVPGTARTFFAPAGTGAAAGFGWAAAWSPDHGLFASAPRARMGAEGQIVDAERGAVVVSSTTGDGTFGQYVRFADLDGVPPADLVVTQPYRGGAAGVLAFLGLGRGRYAPGLLLRGPDVPDGANADYFGLDVGDLDGNGLDEIVVQRCGTGGVSIFELRPAGAGERFSVRTIDASGCGAVLEDVDGDGDLDLAVLRSGLGLDMMPLSLSYAIFVNDGTGGFARRESGVIPY